MFAAERSGRNAPSAPGRPRPSPTYHRHRPPWRLGRPAGSPGRSRRSGLDPRWPAGSGEPAQTPQEPPPPPQRQSSALKRLSLRLPTAPPIGTAPRFDTVQSTAGPLVCSAPDPEGPFSRTNRHKRSRRRTVLPGVDTLWNQSECGQGAGSRLRNKRRHLAGLSANEKNHKESSRFSTPLGKLEPANLRHPESPLLP
ncbi:serine/arginine repetitive matrix protein 1-like [Suricata suricatta]|uniref:serine/arginine repetitive matrix protein 1-like n=1 Tax=Suricata suricatta TaxID=37032 RepID=UPI001155F93F|nr:serine/arginine repetitive matrix protein 1-like [Suricata suricatta]